MVAEDYILEGLVLLVLFYSFFLLFGIQIVLFKKAPRGRYPKIKYHIQVASLFAALFFAICSADPQNVRGIYPRIVYVLISDWGTYCVALVYSLVILSHFQANYLILKKSVPTWIGRWIKLNFVALVVINTIGDSTKVLTNQEKYRILADLSAALWNAMSAIIDVWAAYSLIRVIKLSPFPPAVTTSQESFMRRLFVFHCLATSIVIFFAVLCIFSASQVLTQNDLNSPTIYADPKVYSPNLIFIVFLLTMPLILWWNWLPCRCGPTTGSENLAASQRGSKSRSRSSTAVRDGIVSPKKLDSRIHNSTSHLDLSRGSRSRAPSGHGSDEEREKGGDSSESASTNSSRRNSSHQLLEKQEKPTLIYEEVVDSSGKKIFRVQGIKSQRSSSLSSNSSSQFRPGIYRPKSRGGIVADSVDPKETVMTSFPEEEEPQDLVPPDEDFIEHHGGMVNSESTASFVNPDGEEPMFHTTLLVRQAEMALATLPIRGPEESGLVPSGSGTTLTLATPYHSRSVSLDQGFTVIEATPRSHENSVVQNTSGITSSSISTVILEQTPGKFDSRLSDTKHGDLSSSESKLGESTSKKFEDFSDRPPPLERTSESDFASGYGGGSNESTPHILATMFGKSFPSPNSSPRADASTPSTRASPRASAPSTPSISWARTAETPTSSEDETSPTKGMSHSGHHVSKSLSFLPNFTRSFSPIKLFVRGAKNTNSSSSSSSSSGSSGSTSSNSMSGSRSRISNSGRFTTREPVIVEETMELPMLPRSSSAMAQIGTSSASVSMIDEEDTGGVKLFNPFAGQ